MVKMAKPKPRLEPKTVIVERVGIVTVPPSGKLKEVTDKIVLYCKHPDAKEEVELSTVRYERDGDIDEGALWYRLNDDDELPYESAVAYLLRHYGVDEVESLKGRSIMTFRKSPSSFLVIRAY